IHHHISLIVIIQPGQALRSGAPSHAAHFSAAAPALRMGTKRAPASLNRGRFWDPGANRTDPTDFCFTTTQGRMRNPVDRAGVQDNI
ncbi:MAG: hypothetical protein ACREMY_21760, partial [bacterium]